MKGFWIKYGLYSVLSWSEPEFREKRGNSYAVRNILDSSFSIVYPIAGSNCYGVTNDMYTLHALTDDAGLHLVEVRNEEGELRYATKRAANPTAAHEEAVAWADWAQHVMEGTRESIYYILSVPETWAGPPPGSHPYSGLHFKIGRSRNIRKRLQNLQTGTSGELIVHALEPGFAERESELHKEFQAERRSGEWFSASPALSRHVIRIWGQHRMLPPEHQYKLFQLYNRIDAYRVVRQVMGCAPDMVNPSLNETWHGNVFIDLMYTKLATRGDRES